MKNFFIYSVFLVLVSAIGTVAQTSLDSKGAAKLCKRVSEIKELPRDWGEKGVDKTYDEIVAAGEAVVPCLIQNITITKVMRDPRCPTISTATTIGDVSYFILVDLLHLKFTELLPAKTQDDFKTNGVYAYHEYIDQRGSRKELQQKLRNWFAEHKGKLN